MIIKKNIFSLILFFVFFQASAQRKIVVIGKIANYKEGASVISNKNGLNYVLRGLDFMYWDEKMVGKTIKVWGTFKIEKETKFVIKPPFIGCWSHCGWHGSYSCYNIWHICNRG